MGFVAKKVLFYCMRTTKLETLPRGYKTFFTLNSAEHEIDHTHKCLMPTTIVIITFTCMIKTTFESLKARKVLILALYFFYEHLKFHAQLS